MIKRQDTFISASVYGVVLYLRSIKKKEPLIANNEHKTSMLLLLTFDADGIWSLHGFPFKNNGPSTINRYQSHIFIGS